ncbi:MAG: hypothetical protein Q9228_006548 [Teloschistes exilis]
MASSNDQSGTPEEQEFYVRFKGPEETPFAGGLWKIHVELPDQYPYKSPSIGFVNRIFHPNIDELSGSVCLDVINQTWSPMYDMINIFESFLPQLLRYPNPTDPLNGEAAALLMRDPKSYDAKVKDYVNKYATKDATDDNGDDSEEEDDMSSVGDYVSGEDEEPAGQMERSLKGNGRSWWMLSEGPRARKEDFPSQSENLMDNDMSSNLSRFSLDDNNCMDDSMNGSWIIGLNVAPSMVNIGVPTWPKYQSISAVSMRKPRNLNG